MTADWSHLPYEFLGEISNEIINKVKGLIESFMILALNHLQLLNGNKLKMKHFFFM